MKSIFDGVYEDGKSIYTENMVKGQRVYGEKLVGDKREWAPERSKLGAAILNGLKDLPIKKGSIILYLGASTGTTVSHVSDIVKDGFVYAVEFSERVFRKLLDLQKKRKNIAPIMGDARKLESYSWVEEVDVVYTDIADPQETEITIANAKKFLKKGGYIFIAVKSQSIDVTKKPGQVYKEEMKKVTDAGFEIIQVINLEPYEDKHAMIVAKK